MVENAPGPARRQLSPGTIIAVSLIFSWLLFFLFWPLAAIPILSGGISLASRRQKGWRAIILASPLIILPAFSLARGVFGYLTGTGVILVYGFQSLEFSNLDPQLRCYRSTSGCVINGDRKSVV